MLEFSSVQGRTPSVVRENSLRLSFLAVARLSLVTKPSASEGKDQSQYLVQIFSRHVL